MDEDDLAVYIETNYPEMYVLALEYDTDGTGRTVARVVYATDWIVVPGA